MERRRYRQVLAVLMVVVMFMSLLPPMGSVYAEESETIVAEEQTVVDSEETNYEENEDDATTPDDDNVKNENEFLEDHDNSVKEETEVEMKASESASVQKENAEPALNKAVETNSVKTFASVDFAGGSGTEVDPYIVENAEQLDMIREDTSASYKLGADIDLSSIENWEPIPTFTGTFDGDGHAIKNLTIDRPSTDYVGLFSRIGISGEVKNLTIKKAQVHGKKYVGVLAGYNPSTITNVGIDNGEVTGESNYVGGLVGQNGNNTYTGVIKGSYVKGGVTGQGDYVGGLIGWNSRGTIEEVYSLGNVTGQSKVGGLVGLNRGSIQASYNIGNVVGQGDHVGGLVGWNYEETIQEVYSFGDVTGQSYVGGLVGQNGERPWLGDPYDGIIEKAYTTGSVSGKGSYVKELVGFNSRGTVSNAFVITPLQSMEQETYSAFDFDSVWGIIDGGTIPYLLYNPLIMRYNPETGEWEYVGDDFDTPETVSNLKYRREDGKIKLTWNPVFNAEEYVIKRDGTEVGTTSDNIFVDENVDNYVKYTYEVVAKNSFGVSEPAVIVAEQFPFGTGTAADPYIIVHIDQLDIIRDKPDAAYRLGVDIDLSSFESWEPFPLFSGTFDGDGHTIKNLTIDRPGTDYVGLFSRIGNGGEVRNLTVENAQVKGYRYVGVLAGYNFGTITNVGIVSGKVIGENNFIGGLFGANGNSSYTGTIKQAYSTVDVTGQSNVGGLVGELYVGTIEQAYATGDVTGQENTVGGLIGYQNGSGIVEQAYAKGNVTGKSNVGGLVGQLHSGDIQDVYAIGDVTGQGDYVGGLVGRQEDGGSVLQAYATGDVSGVNHVGGLIGRSEGYVREYSSERAKVHNVFSLNGTVTGSSDVGKAIGSIGTRTDFKNIFAISSMSGEGHDNYVTNTITPAQALQQATYSGFSFGSIWGIDEGETLSYLVFNPSKIRYNPDTGEWNYGSDDKTTPEQPDLRVIGKTTSSIQLAWDEVENATEYVLERRVKPNILNNIANFIQRMAAVITTNEFDEGYEEVYRGTNTSFTDTSVARGTWYDYRVKAVNDAGESDFSFVEAYTYQLVTYNWFPIYDEDGNEATEYIVQHNGEEIGRTTETHYTDDKAVPGETNLYRVIPVFGDNEGGPIEIELERIVLSPSRIELNEGEGKQLKVIAHYSDGSRLDITGDAIFSSSDDEIASVSEAGIVAAHAVGTAEVTADYYGKQAKATVLVVEEPVVQLTGLSLLPSEIEMYPEHTESLTATARYSDGSRKNVNDEVDYYSSNPTVATVDEKGKVTAHAIGRATIIATYEGETAEASIKVIPVPELTGISVFPDKVDLHPGHSRQLTVKAEYDDSTTRTVTKDAIYETSDKSIAVVSDSGLVTGANEGKATITVTYEGKTATTEISVEEQPDLDLTSISVEPSMFDLHPGHMKALKVIANYNDNSKRDVTGEATFTSGDDDIASVSENGTVTAHAIGSTFITAEYEGETADAVVTVKELEEITLTGLKLSPSTVNLHPEGTRQLTATAVYSDDSIRRVTSEATFTSSDSSVAVVSNKGVVTAIGVGKAVIKAQYEGKTAETQVIVSEPVLKYITAFPSNIELEPNEAQQIIVFASYSNNSMKTVTDQATYHTSDETVATVDENGKVTAVDVGYTTITVEYGDKTSIVNVWVKTKTENNDPDDPSDDPELPDAELKGIKVAPSSVKMSPDSVERLVVYAEYSNHSRRNVTKHAAFTSSDESVVFAGENGLLTAIKPGDTKIIVEYKGEQAEASVTVENLPVPVQGPDFIEIAWYEVPGAAYYELLRDGEIIHTEDHEEGKVIYRYKDQPVDPRKVYHYEIVPYREDGSKGDPIEFVSLPEPVFTSMKSLDGEKLRDLSDQPNGSVIETPRLENSFVQEVNFHDTKDFINEYNTGDGWKVYDEKIEVQENGPVFARTRDPQTGSISPSRYHIFNNIKLESDGSEDEDFDDDGSGDEGSGDEDSGGDETEDDTPFVESPTLRVVATTADSVTLEGTKIDRATEYVLERRNENGEFVEVSRKSDDGELIFTDSNLEEKTTYRYRLVATNGKVKAYSRIVSATTKPLPAEAPEWVKAELIEHKPNGLFSILNSLFSAGKYAIEVEWGESEVEPQRYILYRQANEGAITQIAVVNPSEDLSYVDTEVDHDTSYTYYVAALKDGDLSTKTQSNTIYVPKEQTGWVGDDEDPDDYKGEFIWVTQDGDKAKVEWVPALGNPDKYFLYRVDLSNPLLKRSIGVLSGDTLELIDDTVEPGHTYVYYIKAQYRDGIKNYFSEELASDEFTFLLEPDPNKIYTPKNVTAAIEGNTVKLTWDIDFDAKHYFLYRKAGNDILVRFVSKLNGDVREYVDQDVKEGVEYQYFLEAVYPKGKSERVESNKVTIR